MRLIEWLEKFDYLTYDIPVAIHMDAYTNKELFINHGCEYDMNVYVGSMERIPLWLGQYYVVDNSAHIDNGQLNIFVSARNEEWL